VGLIVADVAGRLGRPGAGLLLDAGAHATAADLVALAGVVEQLDQNR
jgi:hypothetical protein